MEMFLGMTQVQADTENAVRGTDEGKELKSATGWSVSAGNEGTNTSKFTGLPNMFRFPNGNFSTGMGPGYALTDRSNYWTATQTVAGSDLGMAMFRGLRYNESGVYMGEINKPYGYQVRLVKD
jgi:uncharacterized protein (TIGR02145 family)